MKIIKTKKGWDEISTKSIILESAFLKFSIDRPNYNFLTAGEWVTYQKNPKKGKAYCECCHTKWKDVHHNSPTYLVKSNKGNKVLCFNCTLDFKLFPDTIIGITNDFKLIYKDENDVFQKANKLTSDEIHVPKSIQNSVKTKTTPQGGTSLI